MLLLLQSDSCCTVKSKLTNSCWSAHKHSVLFICTVKCCYSSNSTRPFNWMALLEPCQNHQSKTFQLVCNGPFLFLSLLLPRIPPQDLVKSLALLESIFISSYPNREGVLPTPKPGSAGLHSAALQAWSLLVTLCPPSRLTVLLHL